MLLDKDPSSQNGATQAPYRVGLKTELCTSYDNILKVQIYKKTE